MMQLIRGRDLGRRRFRLLLATSCLTSALSASQALCANASDGASSGTGGSSTVGEVVVTAGRRVETVSKLPFNISAYGSRQLERANITSVTALSQQVPNFVIEDAGARGAATSIPIIRGLNASQPAVQSARYFQAPVGFYLDNAPITGALPIEDIERVEVLRGPQGTLYGAGALAGAVRIVPALPKLDSFSGLISGSVGGISHSSDTDSDVMGVINIPIGQTAAFRIVAQREYDGGFIDQNNILRRQGNNYIGGVPLLANPGDVANSPGVYFNAKDVNYTETYSTRASFLWKPDDRFKLLLSYSFSSVDGEGGPTDNYTYPGGPSPIDPRITFGATGDDQRSLLMLEPFSRQTQLASMDASYDMGFATVSGTVAFGQTRGKVAEDQTVITLGTPYGHYYTGTPPNPRAVIPATNEDDENNYTEEIRIVSKKSEGLEYIAGLFFEQNDRHIGLEVWDPGANAQSAAANGGSTLPLVEGGAYIPLFSDNSSYTQETYQTFRDYSAYGQLSYHVTKQWQITGGARIFYQTFTQSLQDASSLFLFTLDANESNAATNEIYMANTSYQINSSSQVYFTFSQGFRRGGANAFPISGPVLEPTSLLTYGPDKTNNYEIGAKGNAFGLYYSADLFYIDWSKPQIDLLTPYNLYAVVVNANAADSKGFEFELSGPIPVGPKGLSFNLGLAYARARLTQDFGLPAGNGLGMVIPDAIVGRTGDRLPGAPDFSMSSNVNYRVDLPYESSLTFSLGVDYRGSTVNILPNINPNTPSATEPGYALLHGGIDYEKGPWDISLFGSNLTDAHVVISQTVRSLAAISQFGAWGQSYLVARPREIGVRFTRRF